MAMTTGSVRGDIRAFLKTRINFLTSEIEQIDKDLEALQQQRAQKRVELKEYQAELDWQSTGPR